MRLVVVIFTVATVLLSSCGIVRSTSSINKARSKRENSFHRIVDVYGEQDIVEIDDFGNKSLSRTAADNIFPIERRRAAYYFYKAEAYLSKAYDFRARSRYDDARYLAEKAGEFYALSQKHLGVSEILPPVSTEIEVKEPEVEKKELPPKKSPTEEPETPVEEPETPVEKPETPVEEPETPVEKPETPVEEPETPVEEPETPVEEPEIPVEEPEIPVVPEEKPSLKGDPFEEKAEEEVAEEEKQPSYYDVYEEMRQKYLKKQEAKKAREAEEEKKRKEKKEKKDENEKSDGGAK